MANPRKAVKHSIVMEVRPELVARSGGVAFTPSNCTEHWMWDGKDLKFSKLEGSKTGFKAIFVD